MPAFRFLLLLFIAILNKYGHFTGMLFLASRLGLFDITPGHLQTPFSGTYLSSNRDQRDTTSCGVVTPNTIAVEIFGEEVWEQAHAAAARANCFIRLAHSPAIRVKFNSSFSSNDTNLPPSQASMIPPKRSAGGVRVDAPQEVQVAVALRDHNFPVLCRRCARQGPG
ncbi:hypothetical protein R3P38DRAFT_3567347 [Favolaschia claudopus]|uniref:Uncharacterized protein n=1 Tax=Favolaschia claudopus TaxID=2862362 RepID=A0AAW0AUQ7_9AGAR